MPITGVVLADDSIRLRPFAVADAEAHLAGEDGELARWLSGGVSTRETVVRWILRNHEAWEADGPVFCFAICTPEGVPAGMIEARVCLPGIAPSIANVSYGLYPAWRGRGWARRAVLLVIDYLSRRGDVSHALIQVDPANLRSARVAEACHFRFVGLRTTPDGDVLRTYVRPLGGSG